MTSTHTTKSGAALVIALGFLAVLIIMIVSFAAQSRTGRLAGRAFLSATQCRLLLDTALSRAMEDIDQWAGTNGYPVFYVTHSVGDGTASLVADSVDFRMEEDYFPSGNDAIWQAYSTSFDTAQWQTVVADTGTVGRVGYIIVNTSGLLDANEVGGYTNASPPRLENRLHGLTPREIHLSPELLAELSTDPNRVNSDGTTTPAESSTLAFAYNRDNAWRRFESLRDVALLNQHAGNVLGPPLGSFSLHTLFPQPSPPYKILLSPDIDEDLFMQTLRACGLDEREAQNVYENYRDYIDADNVPANLDGSSPEAVPMLNEIGIRDFQFFQDSIDGTNVEYRLSGTLSMETWYPFADVQPQNTTIDCISADPNRDLAASLVEVVEGESFILNHGFISLNVVYSNEIAKAFVLPLYRSASSPTMDDKFSATDYNFSFDDTVQLARPFEDGSAPQPLEFHILLKQADVIDAVPVDRVQNIAFTLSSLGAGTLLSTGASCVDPRINSDFMDAQHWVPGIAPTPNAPNAINYWGEESDIDDKSKIRFVVRNAPMENAAELGFLSLGNPWSTVRLYREDDDFSMHPVLDRFNTGEPVWNLPARPGLINLNSPHAEAIATAFFDAPTSVLPASDEEWPQVSAEQAKVIGANLAALGGATLATNLSLVGKAVSQNIPGWKQWCDTQKDAIIANSYRLFGWRDTQYILLLAAQAGTDLNEDGLIADDEVRSTRKCIVHVWRDPATGKASCVFLGHSDTLQSSIGSGETWGTILKAFNPDL